MTGGIWKKDALRIHLQGYGKNGHEKMEAAALNRLSSPFFFLQWFYAFGFRQKIIRTEREKKKSADLFSSAAGTPPELRRNRLTEEGKRKKLKKEMLRIHPEKIKNGTAPFHFPPFRKQGKNRREYWEKAGGKGEEGREGTAKKEGNGQIPAAPPFCEIGIAFLKSAQSPRIPESPPRKMPFRFILS